MTKLFILGCGSAKPTKEHTPSSQMLEMCSKRFLIDAGEGAQIAMQQMPLSWARMDNIFISHLHGDHCFGLLGLISTMGMLGRTRSLTIHAHADLERLMRPLLDYFCLGMDYEVRFNHIDPYKHQVIYDDRTLTVTSLPLKHGVPCCGFLFEEKPRLPHIIKEMLDVYNIPIAQIQSIKEGADFVCEDGRVIENKYLTRPSEKPFRYAYCSDTAYSERLVGWLKDVDCLYHEATYTHDRQLMARKNQHSTASEAATVALKANVGKLIIGHLSSRITDETEVLREAQQVFPNTILAKDKTEYVLKP